MDLDTRLYELWVYIIFLFIGLPVLFMIRCMIEFYRFTFRREYMRQHYVSCFPSDE